MATKHNVNPQSRSSFFLRTLGDRHTFLEWGHFWTHDKIFELVNHRDVNCMALPAPVIKIAMASDTAVWAISTTAMD